MNQQGCSMRADTWDSVRVEKEERERERDRESETVRRGSDHGSRHHEAGAVVQRTPIPVASLPTRPDP